jgi:anthranilate phosphoribosyltransferase
VLRELATPVKVQRTDIVDTCGTGGSGSNKFNVSTASAIVAAAAGAAIAKHGNRAASSKSGSADVLEAAGAEIMLSAEQVGRCVDTVGVGFLFALNHHSAMKHAIGPRKEMVVRTVFNLLGPLTNPAGAKRQVLGVYAKEWVRPIAEVLKALGSEHVLVLHSDDGLDEISIAAPTFVAELKNGSISEYKIEPDDFGIQKQDLSGLIIEDAKGSLDLVNAALRGEHEAAMDIVSLNAGAAIYVSGQCANLKLGVQMAQDAIGSGLAREKLRDFVDFTQNLKASP